MIKIAILILLIIIYGLFTKKKKWFTIVFVSLYAILPEYFAVEFSQSLPLLTASRLLLVMLLAGTAFQLRIYNPLPGLKKIGVANPLLIYCVLCLLANLTHIKDSPGVVNSIFIIIFQEFLLVCLLVINIRTEQLLFKCVDGFIHTSAVVFFLGIIEAVTGWKWAYLLTTVSRKMLQSSMTRLGIDRAEATFGHSVYFGLFCVVLIPLIMYYYENTRKKKYIVFLALDLLALIFTSSRGALLAAGILLILMFLSQSKRMLNIYVKYVLIALCGLLILGIFSPTLFETITGIFKSVLNALGFSFELDNYGINQNGTYSRVMQLSVITWVMMHNPLFGMGPNAQTRGVIRFFDERGLWVPSNTYDVGYMQILGDLGIVGAIAYVVLYVSLIKLTFKNDKKNDVSNMNRAFKWCFVGYFLSMLSIATVNNVFWLIVGLCFAYNNIKANEERRV